MGRAANPRRVKVDQRQDAVDIRPPARIERRAAKVISFWEFER